MLSDLQSPIFNPELHFIAVPKRTCPPLSGNQHKSPHHDIVVVYKSGVYNFDSRRQIRRLYNFSYTGLDIHLVFSIGLPRTARSNVFRRDGFNVTLGGRAGEKLMQHAKQHMATQKALENEIAQYDDLIVGQFEDSYFNLTLKLFYTYQWAARFCRPYRPVFIFMDDDYAFNTRNLVAFFKSKTQQEKDKFSYGCPLDYNPVLRPGSRLPQWALSKAEIPWPRHVKELYGIYNIFGYPIVETMALGMHFIKPIPIDDTWLAMIQWRLGIKFSTIDGMFLPYINLKGRKCEELLFAPITELAKKRKCPL